MKILFLYGGRGSYEKQKEVDWPDGAPLPREGEVVYLIFPGFHEITGEVERVHHCYDSQTETLEIRVRLG